MTYLLAYEKAGESIAFSVRRLSSVDREIGRQLLDDQVAQLGRRSLHNRLMTDPTMEFNTCEQLLRCWLQMCGPPGLQPGASDSTLYSVTTSYLTPFNQKPHSILKSLKNYGVHTL